MGSIPGDVGGRNLKKPLSLLASSKTNGGGTFWGSYQQLPADEEEGAVAIRSLSVNSDGGAHGLGVRSLCATRDGLGVSDATPTSTLLLNNDGRGTTGREAAAPDRSEVGGAELGGRQEWFLSKKDRQILKRRTIMERFTPLMVLSSFVSDLDLIADWCYLHYGLADFGVVVCQIALFFAIVGSILWVLSTTEFAVLSVVRSTWKGNSWRHLQHVGLGWQLLANVIAEDLPQFVITIITKPTSVTGVLNLTASGLSVVARVIHGILSKHSPSLSTQFVMIDQDPAVTRNLFKLRDEAKSKAAAAEKLVYLAWVNRQVYVQCSAARRDARFACLRSQRCVLCLP